MGLARVCARVQAHPARRHLHDALVSSLDLPVEVYEHESDPPSPWAGYRVCLTDLPGGSSHLLVIQDDAQVCRNFGPAVRQIAHANPDTPVVLFLAEMPKHTSLEALRAMKDGRRYVPLFLRDFMPAVAILWPVGKAREILDWSLDASLPGYPNPRSDDAVLGRWMISTRQSVLVSVPSLVQHRGDVPSVKGTDNGASTWRAQWFAKDGLDYDWSLSP